MGGSNPTTPDPTAPPGDPATCPTRITVILPDPGDLTPGQALVVGLEDGPPPRVAISTTTGPPLGYVAGVPNLKRLIECLQEGVVYAAHIDRIEAGALHCLLLRQSR